MAKERDAAKYLLRVAIRGGKVRLPQKRQRVSRRFKILDKVDDKYKWKTDIQPLLERRRRMAMIVADDTVINGMYLDWQELPEPRPDFGEYVNRRIKVKGRVSDKLFAEGEREG